MGRNLTNRSGHYLAAAVAPLLASMAWLLFVPPLWHSTDSTVILLWARSMVPHFPPLYPMLVYGLELSLELDRTLIYVLLFTQHILLVTSVIYLALAFRTSTQIAVMSTAAVAGAWMGSLAHTVATQGVELPFLIFLLGFVFRTHFDGWRWSRFPAFVIFILVLSLTRHSSIIFAGLIPTYFVLLALTRYATSRAGWELARYVGYAGACCAAIAITIGLNGIITRATCVAMGGDCPYSITGRAGCYRIAETYGQVPAPQRADWLAAKLAGLTEPERLAFKSMAADGCWVQAYSKVHDAFPADNTDKHLNGAFLHFLLTPDWYSIEQAFRQLRISGYMIDPPVLSILAGSLQMATLKEHPPHDELRRQKLGVTTEHDAKIRSISTMIPVRIYDWFTYYALNIVTIILFLTVLLVGRASADGALGAAILITAIVYLISVSIVTIFVSKYVAPVNLLMYILSGFCLCRAQELFDACGRRSYNSFREGRLRQLGAWIQAGRHFSRSARCQRRSRASSTLSGP